MKWIFIVFLYSLQLIQCLPTAGLWNGFKEGEFEYIETPIHLKIKLTHISADSWSEHSSTSWVKFKASFIFARCLNFCHELLHLAFSSKHFYNSIIRWNVLCLCSFLNTVRFHELVKLITLSPLFCSYIIDDILTGFIRLKYIFAMFFGFTYRRNFWDELVSLRHETFNLISTSLLGFFFNYTFIDMFGFVETFEMWHFHF